jgi:hypothetical protein
MLVRFRTIADRIAFWPGTVFPLMTQADIQTDGRVFYLEFILRRVRLVRKIELDLKNIPTAASRARDIT